MRPLPFLLALSLSAGAVGCATTFDRRFPLAEPMTEDPDRAHVAQEPKEYFSPLAWDGADQTTFFPVSQALSVDPAFRSVNVNAMDEVPDSSWFTNRIGVRDMSPAEARAGACRPETLPAEPPWTVVAAKPNGQTPGFIVKDRDGRVFLLKTDGLEQPYRASTADVLGSRLYYAAGFNAPCNLVVRVAPDDLVIGEDTELDLPLGKSRPITREDVDGVLEKGVAMEDGTVRLAASMFLDGTPLGPFSYQGTREDDPNDVIRHQDRRELRGGKILASWINHFDTREQNSLDMFVEEDGRSFVRHYYIDFGDSLGWYWINDSFSRRFGHSYYLDIKHIVQDFVTFGALKRPWETVSEDETTPWIGYFDVEHFVPAEWQGGYRNPAFERMQYDDAAWMARIIARIDGQHLRAMLKETQIDPADEDHLFEVLMGRRDKLLATWLAVASPLTDFSVEDDRLCFTDLAARNGVHPGPPLAGVLTAHRMPFETPQRLPDRDLQWQDEDAGVACVPLGDLPRAPVGGGVPDDDARRYLVLDVSILRGGVTDELPPARLHFYDLGPERGLKLVGVERPDRAGTPLR